MGGTLQTHFDRRQVSTAFIISVASGFLILLQGVLRIIRTQWGLEVGIGEFRRHTLGWVDYKVLGIVGLLLGAMVILGAFLMRIPGREREGGITVLAFSIITVLSGGGYLAGLILGVIGGALALSHYQPKQQQPIQQ